jgi:hypothetical protein
MRKQELNSKRFVAVFSGLLVLILIYVIAMAMRAHV